MPSKKKKKRDEQVRVGVGSGNNNKIEKSFDYNNFFRKSQQ